MFQTVFDRWTQEYPLGREFVAAAPGGCETRTEFLVRQAMGWHAVTGRQHYDECIPESLQSFLQTSLVRLPEGQRLHINVLRSQLIGMFEGEIALARLGFGIDILVSRDEDILLVEQFYPSDFKNLSVEGSLTTDLVAMWLDPGALERENSISGAYDPLTKYLLERAAAWRTTLLAESNSSGMHSDSSAVLLNELVSFNGRSCLRVRIPWDECLTVVRSAVTQLNHPAFLDHLLSHAGLEFVLYQV